jgi:hypothetical protein
MKRKKSPPKGKQNQNFTRWECCKSTTFFWTISANMETTCKAKGKKITQQYERKSDVY